jgi:hypothetical protein
LHGFFSKTGFEPPTGFKKGVGQIVACAPFASNLWSRCIISLWSAGSSLGFGSR